MRKIALILTLLMIGCKNYNTIEVTFVKSNPQDTSAIRFNLFKLSNQDTIIFQNTVFQDVEVGKKIKFDSLPNGKYTFEYYDMVWKKHIIKINLDGSKKYSREIIFDNLPFEKFFKTTPISTLKNGESYKVENWTNCMTSMRSFYKISKTNDQFFLDSYIIKARKLNDDDIIALKRFEAELYAIRNKGTGSSTGMVNYCVIKGSEKDTIIDQTNNWQGYRVLMRRFHNGN